jgi:hypothetical protein
MLVHTRTVENMSSNSLIRPQSSRLPHVARQFVGPRDNDQSTQRPPAPKWPCHKYNAALLVVGHHYLAVSYLGVRSARVSRERQRGCSPYSRRTSSRSSPAPSSMVSRLSPSLPACAPYYVRRSAAAVAASVTVTIHSTNDTLLALD